MACSLRCPTEVTFLRAIPIVVDALPPEGKAFSLSFDSDGVSAALAEPGWVAAGAAGPLTAEVRVLRSGGDVFALGRFETRVRYRCGRCLEEFEAPVVGEFHVTFAAEPDPEAGERELHREDLDLEPLRAGTLDLGQVVQEQLFLALRPHPVCREDCRGLCPRCGADRDQGPCGCGEDGASSHFAALEAWGRVRRA